MTHRMQPKRLYNIWKKMRQRCRERSDYAHVTVCEEWHVYLNFKAWALANGYAETLTIDRIDNAKGYEPNNCRWTDRKGQTRNRRNTFLNEESSAEVKWLTENTKITHKAIGAVYGIHQVTVGDIKRGITWRDIPAVPPSGRVFKQAKKLAAVFSRR